MLGMLVSTRGWSSAFRRSDSLPGHASAPSQSVSNSRRKPPFCAGSRKPVASAVSSRIFEDRFVGGLRLLRLYEHHHLHRRRLILLAIIVDIGASAPLPAALCSPEVPEPRPSPELARSPR